MLTDWNFWFSIITAIIAIVALLQTKQQIRVGNKQHLFDERLENYLIAEGFIRLYEDHQNQFLIKKDEPEMALDLKFLWMTNNTYLEEISDVINHTLEKPFHKEFLTKLETIKNVASKIGFIFHGNATELLKKFVLCYQESLMQMYQYQMLFKKMNECANEFKWTLEESVKNLNEPQQRMELHKDIENLKQAYDELKKENVKKKIARQIKLR